MCINLKCLCFRKTEHIIFSLQDKQEAETGRRRKTCHRILSPTLKFGSNSVVQSEPLLLASAEQRPQRLVLFRAPRTATTINVMSNSEPMTQTVSCCPTHSRAIPFYCTEECHTVKCILPPLYYPAHTPAPTTAAPRLSPLRATLFEARAKWSIFTNYK